MGEENHIIPSDAEVPHIGPSDEGGTPSIPSAEEERPQVQQELVGYRVGIVKEIEAGQGTIDEAGEEIFFIAELPLQKGDWVRYTRKKTRIGDLDPGDIAEEIEPIGPEKP
jgi:hypothetical protein